MRTIAPGPGHNDAVPARDTSSLIPPNAPEEVKRRAGLPGRVPVFDPTLGIPVAATTAPAQADPEHRLVVIGDSLSEGFQSGAVFNTSLSYPAIIAHELGWFAHYRYPVYAGPGGLPVNLEFLLRDLQEHFGVHVSVPEALPAALRTRHFLDQVEDYWERGPGATAPVHDFVHDLSVYGWTLWDALTRTSASCRAAIRPARDNVFAQVVQDNAERVALRVYPNRTAAEEQETVFDTAARLGADGGIETLIVMLGANNALVSVISLEVIWTDAAYLRTRDQHQYTVWDPQHFRDELAQVRAAVERIGARQVIWCTVPHVTIAPIARAVGTVKARPGSRYFPYYTRPWITDAEFDPDTDPKLTENEARAVDAAIDLYNEAITDVVRDARTEAGRDWLLFDLAGLLDRLATKRYLRDPTAKPDWWTPYPLPPALSGLTPTPDTVFLSADGHGGRATGGLFSLDGVHPTTVAYGIIAQELIGIMSGAGVVFDTPDGTARPDPVGVDFDRLLVEDTLVRSPPQLIDESLDVLGHLDETIGWVKQLLHHGRPPSAEEA